MKDTKGRFQRKRSARERAEMVERFYRSGLSRRAFAEENSLSRSTLDYWLRRAGQPSKSPESKPQVSVGRSNGRPAKADQGPVVFGEMELGSLFGASGEWAVELIGSRGLRIRLREGLTMDELERLLGLC